VYLGPLERITERELDEPTDDPPPPDDPPAGVPALAG
jgi:hypothetical protein